MKILMVGLGGIGQRHVRNLRCLLGDDLEIIAFRKLDRPYVLTDQLKVEVGTDLVEKYKIAVYPELDQALDQKPDVAFICNPTSFHIPVALQAARSGCHLFIEKPLSHDFGGVEELIRIVDEKKLKAVIGYQMRFHPCMTRLHSLVMQKVVGKIISVRAEVGDYMPAWHLYEDYRELYASQKGLGGGVVLTQIHELDYLQWLFGMPQRVFALGGHLSSLDIDVEDNVDILMDCNIDGHSVPISLHMDYLQRPSARTCQIIGDQGKIVLDFVSLSVDTYDGSGNLVESNSYAGYDRNQSFLEELRCFLRSMAGEQTPLVGLAEAAQGLKIALVIKESLQTGRVINL